MQKSTLCFVAVALVGCTSGDSNLVKNGTFGRGLRYWTVPSWQSSGSWVATAGNRSGVLVVTEKMFSPKLGGQTGDMTAASQCIPITPGLEYDVSGRALVPPNQKESGYAVISVVWWKNSRCALESQEPTNDMLVIRKETGKVELADRWQYVALCAFKAPAEARAAEVSLNAVNTTMSLNGTFSAYFDDVVFQRHAKECTFLETF